MSNVISFEQAKQEKILTRLTDSILGEIGLGQMDLTEAFFAAIENAKMIDGLLQQKSEERAAAGLEPNPCFNRVCSEWRDEVGHRDYCARAYECHGCIMQMTSFPPNHLDYAIDPLPSHSEAIALLEHYGHIDGPISEHLAEMSKYENEKAANYGERDAVEIKGISMGTLKKCINTVIGECLTSEFVNEVDKIGLENYQEAIARNVTSEVEKAMGIWPNIKIVR